MGAIACGGAASGARMGRHGSTCVHPKTKPASTDPVLNLDTVEKLVLFGGDAGGNVFLNDLYVMEFSKGKGAHLIFVVVFWC